MILGSGQGRWAQAVGVAVRVHFAEEVRKPLSLSKEGVRLWGQERESQCVSPQLCCLHADMLSSLGPKEAKKAFLDFYHSFLDKTAVRDIFLLSCPLPPF